MVGERRLRGGGRRPWMRVALVLPVLAIAFIIFHVLPSIETLPKAPRTVVGAKPPPTRPDVLDSVRGVKQEVRRPASLTRSPTQPRSPSPASSHVAGPAAFVLDAARPAVLDGLIDRIFGAHGTAVASRIRFAVDAKLPAAPWCTAAEARRPGGECVSMRSEGSLLTITSSTPVACAWGLHYVMKNLLNSTVQWGVDGTGVQLSPAVMTAMARSDFLWRDIARRSHRRTAVSDTDTGEVAVRVAAVVPRRYMYNVCTFGYTSAFWRWEEWESEVDWLALHGINMPLALVGQEAVWLELWRDVYNVTEADIFGHFTGPAFWPWHWMGNLRQWAGPVTPAYVRERRDLQRRILKRMRDYGMSPVLQAFGGHVPEPVADRLRQIAEDNVAAGWSAPRQSAEWMGFTGPNTGVFMLDPADPAFTRIGADFTRRMVSMYGPAEYYNADTFNEMPPHTMDLAYLKDAGRAVLRGIQGGDPAGRWRVQGWLFLHHRHIWTRPAVQSYLDGAGRGNVVVLDLGADIRSMWQRHDRYFGHDFVWCMLHSFGGRRGVFGNMPALIEQLHEAYATGGPGLIGAGLSMEATHHNPALYEFATDLTFVDVSFLDGHHADEGAGNAGAFPWTFASSAHADILRDTPNTLAQAWARNVYVPSRYGSTLGASANAAAVERHLQRAFQHLLRRQGPYAHEVTCCPAWTLMAIGPTLAIQRSGLDVDYSPDALWEAAEAFAAAVRELPSGDGAALGHSLLYDAVDMQRQAMENLFTEFMVALGEQTARYRTNAGYKDTTARAKLEIFMAEHLGAAAMALFPAVDGLLNLDRNFVLQSWLSRAARVATGDGLDAERMAFNAKNLITAWGDSKGQGYPNYAAKSWAGLYTRLYEKRWRAFMGEVRDTMHRGRYAMTGAVSSAAVASLDWDFCVNHTSADLSAAPQQGGLPSAQTAAAVVEYADRWLGSRGLRRAASADVGTLLSFTGAGNKTAGVAVFVKCAGFGPKDRIGASRDSFWARLWRTAAIMCASMDAAACGAVDSKGVLYLPLGKKYLTRPECAAGGAVTNSKDFVMVRVDSEPAPIPVVQAPPAETTELGIGADE